MTKTIDTPAPAPVTPSAAGRRDAAAAAGRFGSPAPTLVRTEDQFRKLTELRQLISNAAAAEGNNPEYAAAF